MMTRQQAKDTIQNLVERFRAHRKDEIKIIEDGSK